ncbi:MAG: RsmB/NOP family class I SAM-dependent RNA methyltransferase, partial [Pseudomonadota bacterium]
SGSGTWRRNPEAKWRLSPEKLLDYMRLQEDILDRAAGLVAGGGQLVYMTCSLLASENSDQIESFLRRQIGWSHRQSRLFTPLNASDGFFVAELRREADI